MKLILALSIAVLAVGCTKTESKSASAPVTTMAPPVKLAGQASALVAPPPPTNKKVCVKGKEKHEFEIQKNGNGCLLNSIDAGKTKEEVSSSNGADACERKEKHLIARLTHSGFQCL